MDAVLSLRKDVPLFVATGMPERIFWLCRGVNVERCSVRSCAEGGSFKVVVAEDIGLVWELTVTAVKRGKKSFSFFLFEKAFVRTDK